MLRFRLLMAIRNLLNDKLNGSIIIGGFSIGFTAFILIALFYNAEHSVNKCFEHADNIYRLYDEKTNSTGIDYRLNQALLENYPEIKEACPVEFSDWKMTIKDPETHHYIRVRYLVSTTNDFFDVFSSEIKSRSGNLPFTDMNSAVITESVAKQLFGDKNPIGRTIEQEFFSATISAVIKDFPENASFKAEILLNSENEEFRMSQACNEGVCINPTDHFIKLQSGVQPAMVAKKLNTSQESKYLDKGSFALQSIEDIYLSPEYSEWDTHFKGNTKLLRVYLFIAILIILLSSVNYFNYSVSRQFSKMKEIGIRKTNGAGKGQLLSDSLWEVSLGVLVSLLLSWLMVLLVLPYTGILFGKVITLRGINWITIIPVFTGVVMSVILLNSLAPIYVLSRFNISEFLSGGRKGNGKQIGKQVMFTFQLAASVALIAVVVVIFKQLEYVKHHDLGFTTEHLVHIDLPYNNQNQTTIKNEMKNLPFVINGALSQGYAGQIHLNMGSEKEGDGFYLKCMYVSKEFVETMGISILNGTDFSPSGTDKECLLNTVAVNRYGWNLAEEDNHKYGSYKVIGEVNDFNVESLHAEMSPVALLYDEERNFNSLSLRLAPGNISEQIGQLIKVWNQFLPDDPMEFTFYDDQFQAMYDKEERLAKSVTFFAMIAIVLTCMGILGQILFITYARTKEIGIRKVNGAKISEILTLLNKDLIKWVAIAFVIATPIAWFAMNKWLENFAYKTNLSWWIFALAGLFALAIALLTVSYQSWKAAVKNPVEALRYE
nr:ABC transporter permease [uncultured Carboxylicivirga sp.]